MTGISFHDPYPTRLDLRHAVGPTRWHRKSLAEMQQSLPEPHLYHSRAAGSPCPIHLVRSAQRLGAAFVPIFTLPNLFSSNLWGNGLALVTRPIRILLTPHCSPGSALRTAGFPRFELYRSDSILSVSLDTKLQYTTPRNKLCLQLDQVSPYSMLLVGGAAICGSPSHAAQLSLYAYLTCLETRGSDL